MRVTVYDGSGSESDVDKRAAFDVRQARGVVLAAREFASWRRRSDGAACSVEASCDLEDADRVYFDRAVRTDGAERHRTQILSVARTIADMEQRERVERADLDEALSFGLSER